MANQGKTVLQLPVKTTFYDANDGVVFVYGYDSANSSNNGIAQSAIIPAANLFNWGQTQGYFGPNPLPAATQSVNVAANTTQIANLFSSPITLVAAAGANTIIVPFWFSGYSSAGTGWTISDSIGIYYTSLTASPDLTSGLINTLVTNASSFSYVLCSKGSGAPFHFPFANCVNQPLVLNADTANPTGGTISITGVLEYFVLTNVP